MWDQAAQRARWARCLLDRHPVQTRRKHQLPSDCALSSAGQPLAQLQHQNVFKAKCRTGAGCTAAACCALLVAGLQLPGLGARLSSGRLGAACVRMRLEANHCSVASTQAASWLCFPKRAASMQYGDLQIRSTTLGGSQPTLLFTLPGAHFSCPLHELTQGDAEQVQAALMGETSPEGPDLGRTALV